MLRNAAFLMPVLMTVVLSVELLKERAVRKSCETAAEAIRMDAVAAQVKIQETYTYALEAALDVHGDYQRDLDALRMQLESRVSDSPLRSVSRPAIVGTDTAGCGLCLKDAAEYHRLGQTYAECARALTWYQKAYPYGK